MSKAGFDYLLAKVRDSITHKRHHRCPISPTERLAVTLRYLASGNSQTSVGLSYRISMSSVSKILRETMTAICTQLEPEVLPPPSRDIWSKSEEEFSSRLNFPNCCGSIDGKHVRIQCPAFSGTMNFNYKGYYSIVLLAVVDPNYKFIAVDIGGCGSISDGGILARSSIGERLQNNTLNIPENKIVGSDILPHLIVGDDAFPLRNNLLKPYPGRHLTKEKRIFNYRLSRARIVAEHAFGILANRWRILHSPIIGDIEFIKLAVKTCVVLHNYLQNEKDSQVTNETVNDDLHMASIDGLQGSNNYSASAGEVRDKFCQYFNNDGAVLWQDQMI